MLYTPSTDDVGAYTVTRTKNSYSEDMRVFFCEVTGQDSISHIIVDTTLLDSLYLDEECMIMNQAVDNCVSNADASGV